MNESNTLSTTPTSETTNSDKTPSVMHIEAQIEQIILNAFSNKLSTGEQAKIHTIGVLLGEVIGVLLPLSNGKIDVDGLKKGLFTLNTGFLQEEAGLQQISNALKNRNS